MWFGNFHYISADPSVISNRFSPDTTIAHRDIVNIFTRKKIYWSDGHKITVFTKISDSIEHKIFIMNILNITPYRYKTMLNTITYGGENTPAIELSSDQEMMSKLSNMPFSVGYINYNIIMNDSINLVKIPYE